jgi:hypothetical protein
MNMISIFRESKSSVEAELAPVFVGIVQVGVLENYVPMYYFKPLNC